MSDNPAPEPTTDTPAPETEPKPEPEPSTPAQDDTDWKAEARKWEKRAKDNSDAAARLKEIEDSKKSEVERLQERIAELEPASKEAARLRVALRKGLTETQAKRLVGDTEEDLEQDADELLATFAPPSEEHEGDTPTPARRPQERLRPGATPSAEPHETDPMKLAEAVQQAKYGF